MKTSQQLKAELAQAEALEKKEQTEAFLKPFRDELAGRYFAYRYRGRAPAFVTGYVSYGKTVKLNSDGDRAVMGVSRVWVCTGTYHHAQVKEIKRESQEVYMQCSGDHTRTHRREITVEEFNQAWDAPAALVEALVDKWCRTEGTRVEHQPDISFGAKESGLPLDIPYLEMQPGWVRFFPKDFMLHGERYLLTPNSRVAVLAKLDEEENRDSRCSHLYEACDMAYVERKRETIAEIRRRL